MLSKKPPDHKDKLGRSLKVGDCVAYPSVNSLEIGTIKKVTPKMTIVVKVGKRTGWGSSGSRKYPQDLVLIEGPEVTMYLLKNSSA